jgi:hypothetical protein
MNLAAGVSATAIVAAMLGACTTAGSLSSPASGNELGRAAIERAGGLIDVPRIMNRITILADDSMLGRGPGQRGEVPAVAYLEREFARVGLEPAGGASYRKPVKLFAAGARGTFAIFNENSKVDLTADRQISFSVSRAGPSKFAGAQLVFVGHAIQAPEFGWDDFKNVDLHGKVAVALEGEPELLSKRGFTPNSQTYHSSNSSKTRRALERGAVALIVLRSASDSVHADRARRFQHAYTFGAAPTGADGLPIAHLSASGFGKVARAAGSSAELWGKMAEDSAFVPVSTSLTASADIDVRATAFTSYNVVGVIPGSDPILRSECVLYVGHWDGYGIGPAVAGDSIYNGALDDAAGVATMLSIAEAMRSLPRSPKRTVVFMAATAEESGMLGSHAYAADPACPLSRTALAVGMDWTWTWGRTGAITSNGFGYSTVDSIAAKTARDHGMTFGPGLADYWLASDHAAFVLRGVPAWFGGLDGEVIGKPAGWAMEQLMKTATHVPSDEIQPTWDMTGAVEEARFLMALGVGVAELRERPRWTVPSEFRRAYDNRSAVSGNPSR